MKLIAQNLVCLINKFNKDELSIDLLRDIFGEMPTIQTPSLPSNINVPLPINLPTIIEFQASGMRIVILPDRIEINETVTIQQQLSGKVKSFLKSIQNNYHINAFGFNFDFNLPCQNNLIQLMGINTKLTASYQDTIINQIRYKVLLDDILYIIDFNENLPNLNIHVNCHFEKPTSSSDLTEVIEKNYDMCYQQSLQLIQSALGE